MSLFRRLLSHRLKSSTVDDLFVFTCAAFGSLAEVQGRGSGHSSGNRPGITWSRYHGRENGMAPRNQSNRAKKNSILAKLVKFLVGRLSTNLSTNHGFMLAVKCP